MFGQFRLAAVVLNRLAIVVCLLVAGRMASAADVTPHQLLAHGDNGRFWVARIEQTPGLPNSLHTTVYYRLLGQDGKWQQLTREPIPAKVAAMASQNSVAAALLDDGTWMLLYGDGHSVNGGPLPRPARMVALAGSSNSWWALGVVPGGMNGLSLPSATQPLTALTQPAATTQIATTRPQSQPVADRLVLFQLWGNDWKPRIELPDPISDAPSASLTFVDDVPYVANLDAGSVLRVRHVENGHWKTDAELTGLKQLAAFQLLGNSTVPRLWVEEQTGPDRLYTYGTKPAALIDLPPIPGSIPSERAFAIAFGKFRMVAVVKGNLQEQDFSLQTGAPDGPPFVVAVPQPSPLVDLERVQSIIVTLALIVAIFGSFRQRSVMRESPLKLEEITLAPVGRRLVAGLIDVAPIILATVGALFRFHTGQLITDQSPSFMFMLIYWCAGIFYVVYTTVIESLAGRSLGKLLMGLRVIGLDGQPAKPGALVLRNVLRVIEVGLAFIPVLMILLFPLRQRAGDVAAGTLVVMDDGTAQKKEKQDEAAGETKDRS
jgi:uncharacterized RDD family membrane protein YckC